MRPAESLLEVADEFAAKAASAPRALAIVTKQTIQAMADIDNHPDAVARELVPQLWSTKQPWFAERLAAVQTTHHQQVRPVRASGALERVCGDRGMKRYRSTWMP